MPGGLIREDSKVQLLQTLVIVLTFHFNLYQIVQIIKNIQNYLCLLGSNADDYIVLVNDSYCANSVYFCCMENTRAIISEILDYENAVQFCPC